jgi:hypothetical protein
LNRAFSALFTWRFEFPEVLPQVRHGESVLWRTGDECRAFGAKHIRKRRSLAIHSASFAGLIKLPCVFNTVLL